MYTKSKNLQEIIDMRGAVIHDTNNQKEHVMANTKFCTFAAK